MRYLALFLKSESRHLPDLFLVEAIISQLRVGVQVIPRTKEISVFEHF